MNMIFDAERFLKEFSIPVDTESKWARPGWLQVECPFCSGNPGPHGGFNLFNGVYHCWRCGWHKMEKVVMKLANVGYHEAKDITGRYRIRTRHTSAWELKTKETHSGSSICKVPLGLKPKLREDHIQYLGNRGFKPKRLAEEYDLKSCPSFGAYKNRIFIPIYIDGQLISYQCRRVDVGPLPYKACKKSNEVMDHQTVVYAADMVPNEDVIVVEGAVDAWKMGPGTVGVFGIAYTVHQVLFLATRFKRFHILFDPGEKQALRAANKLGRELDSLKGVESVDVLELKKYEDPGAIPLREARQMKKEILGL